MSESNSAPSVPQDSPATEHKNEQPQSEHKPQAEQHPKVEEQKTQTEAEHKSQSEQPPKVEDLKTQTEVEHKPQAEQHSSKVEEQKTQTEVEHKPQEQHPPNVEDQKTIGAENPKETLTEEELSTSLSQLNLNEVPPKRVGIFYDDCMLLHKEAGHPEKPERLVAIMQKLTETGIINQCQQFKGRKATKEEILLIHHEKVYENVISSQNITEDVIHFGGDTFANIYSSEAAHVAAGCIIDLSERVIKGDLDNGFAFVRPPGHHAEKDEMMGFCLFNNVAIAAKYAQTHLGVKKVLILDWDVHHGNGTQHIFQDDPTVLYMSVHKGGHFYPGTGRVTEVGTGAGEGKTVNVPFLAAGMGDGDYYTCFKYVFVPIAQEFNPDLVIISAGFDCVKGDKLGPMNVSPVGFEHMLSMLLPLANGKVVCALEGGYSLQPIAECAYSCVKILLNNQPTPLISIIPSKRGFDDVKAAVLQQQKYWGCLNNLGPEWEELSKQMELVQVEPEPQEKCFLQ